MLRFRGRISRLELFLAYDALGVSFSRNRIYLFTRTPTNLLIPHDWGPLSAALAPALSEPFFESLHQHAICPEIFAPILPVGQARPTAYPITKKNLPFACSLEPWLVLRYWLILSLLTPSHLFPSPTPPTQLLPPKISPKLKSCPLDDGSPLCPILNSPQSTIPSYSEKCIFGLGQVLSLKAKVLLLSFE